MQFKYTLDLMSFILIWNAIFLHVKKNETNIKIYIWLLSFCKDFDIRNMHPMAKKCFFYILSTGKWNKTKTSLTYKSHALYLCKIKFKLYFSAKRTIWFFIKQGNTTVRAISTFSQNGEASHTPQASLHHALDWVTAIGAIQRTSHSTKPFLSKWR